MMLWLISAAGIALFLWPFLGAPATAPAMALALGSVMALAAVETGARRLDSRRLALLAAIAAIDAALRLAVVTGIEGFSPIFFLILCAGFVFGPTYGFLAGAGSLLVSGIVTGGVGPWLPYQMFAAGWVGALAGIVGMRRSHPVGLAGLLALAVVGALSGFAYGAVMDSWDWTTFYRGAADFGWTPGLPLAQLLGRFGRFYLATSLVYDSFRAGGNAVMVLALGPPVLAALDRFRSRFTLTILPAEAG